MDKAALIAALLAMGLSAYAILGLDGVTQSTDGFCHSNTKIGGMTYCSQEAATVANDGTNKLDLCFTPYEPNQCPQK